MELPQDVAIVHDWLVGMRGGEKVLEVLCELFPGAAIFTLVHNRGSVAQAIERFPIRTSILQHIPFGRSHYRYFLPLFPAAVRGLETRGFRYVISSSHAAAKGVGIGRGAVHVCYCHTPMRYIWDQYSNYFGPGRAPLPVRAAMGAMVGSLRKWDVATSASVGHFIANSRAVQERIKRLYNRDSTVIHPPVDLGRFEESRLAGEYYLVVSALVPYKRIDVAVRAFAECSERLVVVGAGPEEKRLRSIAGTNVEFKGWVPDAALAECYARSKALIFPGEEDFGIAPVEAMACGKPVIAYARGGALETVIEGRTGVFFGEQTPASLLEAVRRFERLSFDGGSIRTHARQFGRDLCKERLGKYFERVLNGGQNP
jgi:glycosyltransferase involved in cell wall biosynthesis